MITLTGNPMSLRSPGNALGVPLLVFLVALSVRMAVALWLPAEIVWPDGFRYERVAMNLLEGSGFGSLNDNRLSVPTQPMLIAAVVLVFGKSYLALRMFFAVIGAATVAVGFALAKRLFGMTPAVIAGCLLVMYPYLVYLSPLFEYPQTFFIFVMALFFLTFDEARETAGTRPLVSSGLLLGVAILTVPTVLIYVGVALLCLISTSVAVTIKRILFFLAAVVITIAPWSLHNYMAYDRFILVNAAGGISFWLANNEAYYRYGKAAVVLPCAPENENTGYCEQLSQLERDLRDRGITGNAAILEGEALAWRKGIEFVSASPTRFANSVLGKFGSYWSPIPNAVHKGSEYGGSWRDVVSILSYVPVLILGLWGVVLSFKNWRRLMPIYLYFVAFSAPYYVFLPTTRYRLPLDFLLVLFAGLPLARWWKRWQPLARNWTRAGVAVGY
jgi:4-amino-4-deoxy-L-arabinose transferase-like glycosyltransferase